jgi:vesicle coat complex subunit
VQLLCTNHIDPAISCPILIACLQHKDFGVRANALNAMITQKSWGDAERDAIAECITDTNAGVRANAIFALNLFPRDKLSSASTNLTHLRSS